MLLAVVLAVTLVFTTRLLQLQAVDAHSLASAALGNRLVEVTTPAVRGTITDAEGAVLAETVERRDITADPKLFVPDGTRTPLTPQQAAEQVAPLVGLPVEEVAATLTYDGRSRFAYVAQGVTPQVWRSVQALDIPGLYSERTGLRTYPAGDVAGNLVGFVSGDGRALAGLEMAQDDLLTGTDGVETYERGHDGQRIPMGEETGTAPVDGTDVRLTVDRDLQWYAQQAIAAKVAETGAQWGTVVAMSPQGEVLALAEAPSLDPNDPGASDPEDRGNRALQDVVEPGSTAKVITAAAAIEEGLVAPDTRMVVPYRYTTPNGQTFRDSHPHEDEERTFAGVLASSSNTGTVMVGERLTPQQRYDYLRRFGMGERHLGMPGETAGILTPPSEWDGRQQYTVLFGQGYGVNVLQAAQVYATLANGGVRMPTRVVAGTTAPDGTYAPADPGEGTRVVSEETARSVVSMLEGVVSAEGTGASAAVPGFRVAGKTGTAQAAGEGGYAGNGYTSSFIGVAPAEDPQVVVAVTLQRPQTDYYGGTVAAPVFSDVMAYALAQRGVEPSSTEPDLVPLTYP
ncbi:penicillin-binding protein 2 [Quadrisphaera sp. DSM 44207]|uniref:peptidoglycan D,D-transpeptidase FtsI family protein n=1 Tax=Quadrisphaera sp. DSM 44207 TaxID=1881057 RepID=UPI001C409071|nr:penicillin-binding protein 2 [Quadrisphaera sp. DSM 44207]